MIIRNVSAIILEYCTVCGAKLTHPEFEKMTKVSENQEYELRRFVSECGHAMYFAYDYPNGVLCDVLMDRGEDNFSDGKYRNNKDDL